MPEIKQDLRTATMIVAAGNSLHRNDANYVCDGVADNVEIQAALDAVAAGLSTMGRVILLDGWYFCTAGITIPDNVTLEGQGHNVFIDFAGAAIVNGLIINGDYVSIKNLAVNIADGAGVGGVRPNAIYSTGHDHTWIENVYIYGDESVADDVSDLRQCGILLINGSDSKIIDCFVRDFLRHGIHLNNYIDTTIEGNSSLSNGQWGILVFNNSDWNVIVGNKSYINGHGGINIATSDDCTVTGNVCDTNDLHGILLWDSDRNTVTGNVCESNEAHGINLESSEDNTISGNNCCNNDSGDTGFNHGIRVDVDSVNNQITGNVCDLNHGRGMNIVGAHNNINANQCSTNDRCGIYCSGPECQINDNHIYDNGQDAAGTYHGIELGGTAANCQVNDNYCDSPEDSQEDGIHLDAGAHYIQIIGNYCLNGMGDGIELGGNNDYCLIKDNYCYNNDDYGIAITAATCEHNTVENNKLEGNGAGAINDAGTDTILPFIYEPVPEPGTIIGTHPATLLTDGVDVVDRIGLYVPLGFQELVRAQVVIVPGGTGDLRRSVATNWGKICVSEVYNADTDAIAAGEVAVTINELECLDISAALTGLAAGDLVGIEFTRHGAHANDTVGANCYLLGVRMEYV